MSSLALQVGQLRLHAAMCAGRSYNCIAWLEGTLASYDTLAAMSYNPHLPRPVRGAVVDLVRALFLDRFPQQVNCGRASLPEQLFVYGMGGASSDGSGGGGGGGSSPGGHGAGAMTGAADSGGGRGGRASAAAAKAAFAEAVANGTPLVRPLPLTDAQAMPCFHLAKTNAMHGDPNPLLGFPSHYKFFVFRGLGNKYLESFGARPIVHADRAENALAGSMCALASDLISYGFQSSYPKFQVPPLSRTPPPNQPLRATPSPFAFF